MSSENLLKGARIYLSGPMDFVASRENERRYGWRRRVSDFLKRRGATVFDPWYKPMIRGLGTYGEEDDRSTEIREEWTFREGPRFAAKRFSVSRAFWPTLHIDLRMVDLSDFIIAYCPTNLYSVGTVHEIVVARQQHKPVLFVSPSVRFSAVQALEEKAEGDDDYAQLLDQVRDEVPIRENRRAIPSLWYLALVGSESFFDGFGFTQFQAELGRLASAIDMREQEVSPARPLLPFLERMSEGHYPKEWDPAAGKLVDSDDWLLLRLQAKEKSERRRK